MKRGALHASCLAVILAGAGLLGRPSAAHATLAPSPLQPPLYCCTSGNGNLCCGQLSCDAMIGIGCSAH